MNDLAQFIAFGALIGALFTVVVNLLFALGVLADVEVRRRRGQPVRFVSGFGWFAAALIGSFVGVAFYWLVHDSTLVAREPEART